MLIRDVLNEKGRRVISIGPEASVKQALALFVEHNIGSLPVVEASASKRGSSPNATCCSGTIAIRALSPPATMEIMTSNPITCDPKDTLAEAMGKMARHHVGQLPVVDGSNRWGWFPSVTSSSR